MTNLVMLVMVEVVIVIGTPTSSPRNLILVDTGIIFFSSSQFNHTAFLMESSLSKDDSVGASGGSLFSVESSDSKCDLGCSTTHLSPHK